MFSIGYKLAFWWQSLLPKNELYRSLLLSCIFSVSLVVFRVAYTGETMFLFLVWNLFLAYLPFALSAFIYRLSAYTEKRYLFVLLICWLLLIPNAFYILTDLFHLRQVDVVPLWFDLALITSFAWNGLVMGILSVRQVEKMVVVKWKKLNEYCFIIPIMFLNALGIYIGRYLRFNSWDVISNPLQLVQDVGYFFLHPVRHRFDWGMVICFTLLLSFFYLTMKAMSRHISR